MPILVTINAAQFVLSNACRGDGRSGTKARSENRLTEYKYPEAILKYYQWCSDGNSNGRSQSGRVMASLVMTGLWSWLIARIHLHRLDLHFPQDGGRLKEEEIPRVWES